MDNDLMFARIASQFFGRPLLIRPQEAELVGAYLRSRMDGAGPDASRFTGENQFDDQSKRWKGYRVEGSVGIVTVLGELVNRGAWLGASSGLTSYEGIAQQARSAANDDKVERIALDIQSPGGEAVGMAETSRLIRSISKEKPVTAIVNGMAASAAYGLASGADKIVVTESAISGSIGVVLVHFDQSRRLESMGVRATLIHAGALKVVGNKFGPLSRSDEAVLQSEVDRFMTGFVSLISSQRDISEDEIRATEAGIFIGQEAVDIGLADEVGTFESVLADLSRAPGGRSTSPKGRFSMSDNKGTPAAGEDVGISKADHDKAVADARTAGKAEGVEEGKKAGFDEANTRIKSIVDAEGVKGNASRLTAALSLAAKSPDMSAEDIVAFAAENIADAKDGGEKKPEASLDNRDDKPDSLAAVSGENGSQADAKNPWGSTIKKLNAAA